jgi:YidC/Oxa1 family membrane protein insertase
VERRFVSFIILAMAILLGYQALSMRLNPQPAQPDANGMPPAPADGEEGAADHGPAAPADGRADDAAGADEHPAEAPDEQPPADAAEAQAVEPAADRPARQWITLGSLDPQRPEKMLVWFNNEGAAIECIALNDPRYLDLETRYGYLGYLALRETPEGCRIGAVGHGTPAAEAAPAPGNSQPTGLRAGDILEQLGDQPIKTIEDYRSALRQTRPGRAVLIRVRRSGSEGPLTAEYTATPRRRPLEVIRPEPEEVDATRPPHPLSFLLTLQKLGDKEADFKQDELAGLPSLKRETWDVKPFDKDGVSGVEFHFVLSRQQLQPFGIEGPLRIIKRYTLSIPDETAERPATGFHLRYDIAFRNESEAGAPIKLAFQQNGPNGLPTEGWWYTFKTHPRKFGGAGIRDVVFRMAGGRHEMFTNPKIVDRIDEPNPMLLMFDQGNEPLLDYMGVDAQFFLSALLPDPEAMKATPEKYRLADAMALAVGGKDPIANSRTNVSFRLISPIQSIAPNQQFEQRYLIFAGPKHPDVLTPYGLEECITYGWFRVVAKPLQWVLHAFHAVFRNYGIAIILLTVLVRGCMFPLGRQQVMNAQKMQELAPEMRRIAEQYKNDMEKRAAAQRELFRKHNYNPMAGCLPMFFQLPIFIGLYRALSVDIQLRQAPLIPGLQWCSNLAGPDQFLNWEGFMPAFLASRTGWLGPYLNILPIVSVAFMMLHQKMFTPPPTDEQQVLQQRMMKFMMLFFALMFFKVPAGLCIYFITSSAWGLAERKLLPKAQTAAAGGGESGGAAKKVVATVGASATSPKRKSKTKRR